MATYIMLSQVSPDAFRDANEFKEAAKEVSSRIRSDCPGVRWKSSYATIGRFDFIDIIEADDLQQVSKASMIIRTYGHSTTETLAVTPWKEFLANL